MTLAELKVRCEALAAVGDEQSIATLRIINNPETFLSRVPELESKNALLAMKNLELHNELSNYKWIDYPAQIKKLQADCEEWERKANGPTTDREKIAKLDKEVSDLRYILGKIASTMTLAEKIIHHEAGQAQMTRPETKAYQGVQHKGSPIDPPKQTITPIPPLSVKEVPADHHEQMMRSRAEAIKQDMQSRDMTAGEVNKLKKEFDDYQKMQFARPVLSPEEVAAAATRKAMGLPPHQDAAVIEVRPTTAAGSYDKTPKMTADGGGNKD